jgi:hypothetical protein
MTNPQASTTPLQPADLFAHLIITYLTPMFLAATGGDIPHARIAATQAVKAYTAGNPIDLLSFAQVIAFGLATLDSLNRSMAEDLPVALVLRLRGNAVSLGRIADRCRRALPAVPSDDAADRPVRPFDPEAERQREAAVMSNIARAEQRLFEATANTRVPQRPITPAPTSPLASTSANPVEKMLQAARDSQRRVGQPGFPISGNGIPP